VAFCGPAYVRENFRPSTDGGGSDNDARSLPHGTRFFSGLAMP